VWFWLFGRKPTGRGVLLGDGQFAVRIVGTAYHQGNLERIIGTRSRATLHRRCAALLKPEPSNRFDRHAVVILMRGVEVGHLDRAIAPLFCKMLRRSGFADVACEAEIVGGWVRGPNDWGYVGARLNAEMPFKIISAEQYGRQNQAAKASSTHQAPSFRHRPRFAKAG
jgi:hypothetical protein